MTFSKLKPALIREVKKFSKPLQVILIKGADLVDEEFVKPIDQNDVIKLDEYILMILTDAPIPWGTSIRNLLDNQWVKFSNLYLMIDTFGSAYDDIKSGNRFAKRMQERGTILFDVLKKGVFSKEILEPKAECTGNAAICSDAIYYAKHAISAGKCAEIEDIEMWQAAKKDPPVQKYAFAGYQLQQGIKHCLYAYIVCAVGYYANYEDFKMLVHLARSINEDINYLFSLPKNGGLVEVLVECEDVYNYSRFGSRKNLTSPITDAQITRMAVLAGELLDVVDPVCDQFFSINNPNPHGRSQTKINS